MNEATQTRFKEWHAHWIVMDFHFPFFQTIPVFLAGVREFFCNVHGTIFMVDCTLISLATHMRI